MTDTEIPAKTYSKEQLKAHRLKCINDEYIRILNSTPAEYKPLVRTIFEMAWSMRTSWFRDGMKPEEDVICDAFTRAQEGLSRKLVQMGMTKAGVEHDYNR